MSIDAKTPASYMHTWGTAWPGPRQQSSSKEKRKNVSDGSDAGSFLRFVPELTSP